MTNTTNNSPKPTSKPTSPLKTKRIKTKRRKKQTSRLSHMGKKWKGLNISNAHKAVSLIIEVLLLTIIILAPLPLGSVAPWAKSVLFISACLLLFLWTVKSSLQGWLEIVRQPLWILLFTYLLLLGFQLLPLPQSLLSTLSPKTVALYSSLIPASFQISNLLSLSLNPFATTQEFYRILTFIIFMFVFLNHYRDKKQISIVLWALAALGLFEALYGLSERFSDNPHIFWVPTLDRNCVHGTYYNRNHFAGLMEMITLATLGFLLTMMEDNGRSWRSSQLSLFQRLEQKLSKRKMYRNILFGLAILIMLVSGILSLSRGGTIGILAGFFIILIFSQKSGKGRGRRLLIFSVLLLAIGLLLYQGMDLIINQFEQLTEDSMSWRSRTALYQAGFQLFKDFPLLGTGGGTFRDVFLTYQPKIFGDKVARYVHNDWLQVACETGIIGALIMYTAIGLYLISLLRKIQHRTDSYNRFLFAGAFAGVVALLLHSLVEFNLYMVTANGLIFIILLGICHTTVHMKGRLKGSKETFPVLTIPINSKMLRILLPTIALLICLTASIPAVKAGLADVAFNRYLTWAKGEPNLYFFWKTPQLNRDEAKQSLDRATRLVPLSPEYHFHQGLFQVKLIEESVQELAREMAIKVSSREYSFELGNDDPVQNLAKDITSKVTPQKSTVDEESEEFKSLVSAFVHPAKIRLQDEIRADLKAAEADFRKAILLAPTVPWYHMDLAMAYANHLVPGVGLEQERVRIEKLVENAISLAPNRPSTLYRAGWYYSLKRLVEIEDAESQQKSKQKALMLFKKALKGEPEKYAYRIYTFLLDEVKESPKILQEITPETDTSQYILLDFLRKRTLWADALPVSETLLASLNMDPKGQHVPDIHPETDDFNPSLEASLWHLQILQKMGMHDDYRNEYKRVFTLLKRHCPDMVSKASLFVSQNRLTEAMKYCKKCLQMDRNNLEAFLCMTDILLNPGTKDRKDSTDYILKELLRIYHSSPTLSRKNCEHITEILSQLKPSTATGHLIQQFIEAMQNMSCGQPEETIKILKAILLVKDPSFLYWHQRHLIHHYLGRALEMSGEKDEAVQEYLQALRLAPSHKASLSRLAALGWADEIFDPRAIEPSKEQQPEPDEEQEQQTSPALEETVPLTIGEQLLALTPDAIWEIDLSGKLKLLGLTIEGEAETNKSEGGPSEEESQSPLGISGFNIRYFWEVVKDLAAQDYQVEYYYFNASGDFIFRIRQSMQPNNGTLKSTLDGGIGTVLQHQHEISLPREIIREVRVQVRQKSKGKLAYPLLKTITGSSEISLGLGDG